MERFHWVERLPGNMISAEEDLKVPWSDATETPEEFESFYRRCWGDVYRVLAVVLRNPDLAAEATDEAMTRALERWNSVSRHRNPAGWVYVVARNWARSRMRRTRHEIAVPHDLSVEAIERDVTLDRAIAALGIHHREVVVLHYLMDLTQPEMARMLRIPEGTVKSRLNRALGILRREIDNDA